MSIYQPKDIKQFLKLLSNGYQLSSHEIFELLEKLSASTALSDQRAAFLMALSLRGENEQELLGATQYLRSQMIPIQISQDCVDIVGTGGDGFNTFNISTAAAFVAAGAGAKVAKHGNKSASSQSGSTDVLSALDINIDLPVDRSLKILHEIGICFLWAQAFHPILKQWSTIRSNLGIRSIFNLVGPLCNPGNIKRQILGVCNLKWMKPFANVLKELGAIHVWIVCGHEGLDELSTTGPSHILELKNDKISSFELIPEDLSIKRANLSELVGGNSRANAEELRAVLKGKRCAYRDVVVLNAAALLVVAGIAPHIQKGIELASTSIDMGLAIDKLDYLVKCSNNKIWPVS